MLIHKGTQELDTERLRLRRYNLSDAAYMYKNYATDEQVTKFLNWKPYKNIEEIKLFIQDVINEYSHMIFEGTLKKYYLRHDGTVSDALVYSISRNEEN